MKNKKNGCEIGFFWFICLIFYFTVIFIAAYFGNKKAQEIARKELRGTVDH